MAPEIWRGEPATAGSDVYSLGVVLFELCAGRPPPLSFAREAPASAAESSAIQAVPERGPPERGAPPLGQVAPGVPPALAAVIDRCVGRDPSRRFADGDALREALERIAAPGTAAAVPEGGPYRGLLAFEAEHRGLFFGRSGEVRAILDRLRAGPFVLVAGDSGAGKSSLCRAGVLPAVAAGALDGPCAVVSAALGREPLASLASALAPLLGGDEASLADALRHDPASVARALRLRREPALLFVDQLEELCTLAAPAEATAFAEALARLAARGGGARVLGAVRSDFLARLSSLPGLGDDLAPALFFLRQLSRERLREAIVEPAHAKGYAFESDAMVTAMVTDAMGAGGGLPLLQFALAELWEARDDAQRVIPARALAEVGGVAGALARHADGVIAGLQPSTREAARATLLRLVTEEGTRARRTEAELLGDAGRPGARAALDALVRGRLLVASRAEEGEGEGEGAAYTIAHEALLTSWETLRGWLRRGAEARATQQRLERAATDWERLGRPGDALWADRRLDEAAALDPAGLSPREAGFLAASRDAARRRRLGRWAAALAVPILIGLAVAGVRLSTSRALDRRVAEARGALDRARAASAQLDGVRGEALARFDAGEVERAERAWAHVLAEAPAVAEAYAAVCGSLELVLRDDAGRSDARALLGDALLDRVALADRDGHAATRDELRRRLAVEGDAAHRARALAPARLSIVASPPGAAVSLSRFELKEGRRVAREEPRRADGSVAPGSLLLRFSAPGRVPVRLPILLAPGEAVEVTLHLPAAGSIPEGFVLVPAGRFLWGTGSGEEARAFFGGPPLHPAETGAFLIARDETTYADWLAFLRALPEEERRRRAPSARDQGFVTALAELPDGGFELMLGPEGRPYTARTSAPLRYPGRRLRAEQDWARLPVSGVSFEDALRYVAWLDQTGRVPGARLCDEREWERAARGADGREFPGGDRLGPDDADHDLTYGRDPESFGPDMVGAHPASDSPFGVHDLAGNVWEWTTSVEQPGAPVLRGGGFYQRSLDSRCENRQPAVPAYRSAFVGVRACATPPAP
jgi:formylglycine-generating enzyme required for sulfatase activity